MKHICADIVIIGGGPAGLAAAISARENGAERVLILERDQTLGGILNQCIHTGFGLHTFKEDLTGPEYAQRFIDKVERSDLTFLFQTIVLSVSDKKCVTALNTVDGLFQIQAKAVILAMGCRERARGSLNIPGFRPAGVYSAGTAQRLVNMEGLMPGREVVVLGSGDIGLIMARRMTLEGAHVQAVLELMPFSGGLKRNIVQCLDDYDIPLLLSHTVVDIHGKERLTGVTIAAVDEKQKPISGTQQKIACDTLLLSVGLIPENELTLGLGVGLDVATGGAIVNERFETDLSGVFACGNVLHVHDLVDFVTQEATSAGASAAEYIRDDGFTKNESIPLVAGDGIRYTVPQRFSCSATGDLRVRFRVSSVLQKKYLSVYLDGERIMHRKKAVMTPGEMEEIILDMAMLTTKPNLQQILVTVEED